MRTILFVLITVLLLTGCEVTSKDDIVVEKDTNECISINDLVFISSNTLPEEIIEKLGVPDKFEGLDSNLVILIYMLNDGGKLKYSYGYHTQYSISYVVYDDFVIVLDEENEEIEDFVINEGYNNFKYLEQ